MSKFKFHGNGITGEGFEIWDIGYDDPNGGIRHIGLVAKSHRQGWVLHTPGNATPERFFRTRKAAAERALIVSGLNAVAQSALPADPFEGVSA